MKIYEKDYTEEETIKWIKNYVNSVKKNQFDRYHTMMQLVDPTPSNGATALDYGCGWGHFSVAIAEKGYRTTGLDISANEIEICRSVWSHPLVSFVSTETKEIHDHSFDLVFSNQVIEHVHNCGNYLSEINRLLKSDGKLVIGLPNIINPRFALPLMRKHHSKKLINLSEKILASYDKGHVISTHGILRILCLYSLPSDLCLKSISRWRELLCRSHDSFRIMFTQKLES